MVFEIHNLKESVLKKFRKDFVQEKLDFSLIYPTTNDAVHHILTMMNTSVSTTCFTVNPSFYETNNFQYRRDTSQNSLYVSPQQAEVVVANHVSVVKFSIEHEDTDDCSNKTTSNSA